MSSRPRPSLTADTTVTWLYNGQLFGAPAGYTAYFTGVTIQSGTITVNPPFAGSGGAFTISGGAVTAISAGTVITGPATATPYVFPIAPVVSSAVGAAPAAGVVGSSPGLAGTAGIQPQLNVDALSAAAD